MANIVLGHEAPKTSNKIGSLTECYELSRSIGGVGAGSNSCTATSERDPFGPLRAKVI